MSGSEATEVRVDTTPPRTLDALDAFRARLRWSSANDFPRHRSRYNASEAPSTPCFRWSSAISAAFLAWSARFAPRAAL